MNTPSRTGLPRHAASEPRTWLILTWAVAIVGVMSRLIRFLGQRSLWMDEAMLSLNILSRDWGRLLQRLDYEQVAPPAFLVLEKLATLIFGSSELALRALPLLAAISVPFIAWRFARGLLPPRALFLFVGLCSFSPLLIHYGNEVKQYSLEAMLAVLIAWRLRAVVETPERSKLSATLGLLLAFAILASTSAALVIAAAGIAALTVPEVRRLCRQEPRRVLALGLTVAVASVLFLIAQAPALDSPYMDRFWAGAFLSPGTPNLLEHAWSAARTVVSGFLLGSLEPGRWGAWVEPAIHLQTAGTLVIMGLGIAWLARRVGAWSAVFVSLCFALPILASGLEVLPISGRQMLFTAPFLFLLVAAGVELVASLLSRSVGIVLWSSAVFAFLAPPAARMAIEVWAPVERQDVRPLVERLDAARAGTEQVVYVSAAGIPAWMYYTTDWDSPNMSRLDWVAPRASDGGPLFHSRPSRDRTPVREGDELVLRDGGRTEILGLPTGREIRWGGFVTPLPDVGWAANEARRIRSVADDEVWVLYVPIAMVDLEPAYGDLVSELEARGGLLVERYSRREADLLLFRFQ